MRSLILSFSTAEDIWKETPEELAGEDGSEDTQAEGSKRARESLSPSNLAFAW